MFLSFDLSSFSGKHLQFRKKQCENQKKKGLLISLHSFCRFAFNFPPSFVDSIEFYCRCLYKSLRKDGLQGGRPRESYEFRCLLVDPTWTHDPKEVGAKKTSGSESFDSQDGHPWFCEKTGPGDPNVIIWGKLISPKS